MPDRQLTDTSRRRVHRPEIDGLRALAVLPVIFFHAGFATFGGGYIGVDIFFVISGFLITSILIDELSVGRFSIARFYERRARRILPALFIVILACLPFAWRWLLPSELTAFGQSMVAVALFVSNIFFRRNSGYFDGAAAEKPLLHTWSLGVEEQYYLFFPLLMAICWRFGMRRLLWIFVSIAIGSFAVSVWMVHRNPVAAFYLIPTRAWELFAGSFLALYQTSRQHRQDGKTSTFVQEVVGLTGLILILAPVFLYTTSTAFPGGAALPPVLGTILVLMFATPSTLAGRLLTLKPMVWVGLISYSAYLWHQPIFVFARISHPTELSTGMTVALIIFTLLLSYVSWRFIETPFRDRKRWSRSTIFSASLCSTLILIVAGATLVRMQGAPNRWDLATRRLLMPEKTHIEGCPAANTWVHVCRLGMSGTAPSIALIGDSHAYALAPAFDESLRRSGTAGILVHTSCHPIPEVFDDRESLTRNHVAFCDESNRRMMDFLRQSGVRAFVLAIRWTARLYPMGNGIDEPFFDNLEGGVEHDYPFRQNVTIDRAGHSTAAAEPKVMAVAHYLNALAAMKPTVVVYPIPEVGWYPPKLDLIALNKKGALRDTISTSWERFRTRNAVAEHVLNAITASDLHRSKPETILCNTFISRRCTAQLGDQLYYYDDDHLSMTGARLVVADIFAQLRQP